MRRREARELSAEPAGSAKRETIERCFQLSLESLPVAAFSPIILAAQSPSVMRPTELYSARTRSVSGFSRGSALRSLLSPLQTLLDLGPQRSIELSGGTGRRVGRQRRAPLRHALDFTPVRHFGRQNLWKLLARTGNDFMMQGLAPI